MKLEPVGDKIIVRRDDAEEATAGGVVLPDAARDAPHRGRVLSVGDGKLLASGLRQHHQVGEGDRILYSKYAGTEVRINGSEYLILSEDDVLAVVG